MLRKIINKALKKRHKKIDRDIAKKRRNEKKPSNGSDEEDDS